MFVLFLKNGTSHDWRAYASSAYQEDMEAEVRSLAADQKLWMASIVWVPDATRAAELLKTATVALERGPTVYTEEEVYTVVAYRPRETGGFTVDR